MASESVDLGKIGETYLIYELLKYGSDKIQIYVPDENNYPYDLIICINNKLYKTQVKSTKSCHHGKYMTFKTYISIFYGNKKILYSSKDVDMFLFYCLENNYCGLMLFDECIYKTVTLRIKSFRNSKNIKYASDFELHKRLDNLLKGEI